MEVFYGELLGLGGRRDPDLHYGTVAFRRKNHAINGGIKMRKPKHVFGNKPRNPFHPQVANVFAWNFNTDGLTALVFRGLVKGHDVTAHETQIGTGKLIVGNKLQLLGKVRETVGIKLLNIGRSRPVRRFARVTLKGPLRREVQIFQRRGGTRH